MDRSQLDDALNQQAMPDISRRDELETLVGLLERLADRQDKRSSNAHVFDVQQALRSVALARLNWQQLKSGQYMATSVNGRVFILGQQDDHDDYRLICGWFGYGAIGLGTGSRSELVQRAQTLAREGGPYGGPVPDESDPYPWYKWQRTRWTLRRGGLAGELLVDIGAHVLRGPDDHALYCGYRDGAFACVARGAVRNLVPLGDKLANDERLRDLCPPVTAKVGNLTLPWRFLDQGPYKGIISTPTADLLLVDVGNGMYAIICAYGTGQYIPLALRSVEQIVSFDVKPILSAFIGPRAFEEWLKLTKLKPTRPNGQSTAERTRAPSPAALASDPPSLPRAPAIRPLPPGISLPTASPRSETAATSSHATKPASPALDLEELVLGHLKPFHQRLPTGENGSATARALLLGIVRAYLSGAPSIEGSWRDVFEPFVASGDLDDMPSDKTARATLNMLKASPLVRRVDHQRWRICIGEARDPSSELIQLLLRDRLDRER